MNIDTFMLQLTPFLHRSPTEAGGYTKTILSTKENILEMEGTMSFTLYLIG